MLTVHESLSRLEKADGRQARIVELRYFGGLTVEEAGEVVGISTKTLMRELNVAKDWLDGDLKDRVRTPYHRTRCWGTCLRPPCGILQAQP